MVIIGIGIDATEIRRIAESIERWGDRFTQRTSMRTAGTERVALVVTTEGRRVGECAR